MVSKVKGERMHVILVTLTCWRHVYLLHNIQSTKQRSHRLVLLVRIDLLAIVKERTILTGIECEAYLGRGEGLREGLCKDRPAWPYW